MLTNARTITLVPLGSKSALCERYHFLKIITCLSLQDDFSPFSVLINMVFASFIYHSINFLICTLVFTFLPDSILFSFNNSWRQPRFSRSTAKDYNSWKPDYFCHPPRVNGCHLSSSESLPYNHTYSISHFLHFMSSRHLLIIIKVSFHLQYRFFHTFDDLPGELKKTWSLNSFRFKLKGYFVSRLS